MKPKISQKLPLLITGVAGTAFFLILIFFLTTKSANQSSYNKQATTTAGQSSQNAIGGGAEAVRTDIFTGQANLADNQENAVLPARLSIPRIGVDAPVVYVGTTPKGEMDVPKGPDEVAWFKFGPRPGETGSAVIAGHEGWKDRIPAVFDNLYKLRKGDKIYIENENGKITTFVVRESRIYGEGDDASGVFVSSDGKAHLNLVTCSGAWNKAKKSYANRLVVFTDKVN